MYHNLLLYYHYLNLNCNLCFFLHSLSPTRPMFSFVYIFRRCRHLYILTSQLGHNPSISFLTSFPHFLHSTFLCTSQRQLLGYLQSKLCLITTTGLDISTDTYGAGWTRLLTTTTRCAYKKKS